MATPRREKRTNELGVVELRCWCDEHKGKWLSEDLFNNSTYRIKGGKRKPIKLSYCKRYYMLDRRKRRDPNRVNAGRLPASEIRPYLDRIVAICGSYNSAARTLGIQTPTIYKWVGRSSYHNPRFFYNTSVERILNTLHGLQNGTIEPVMGKRTSARVFKFGCRGCGTDLDNYTVGCDSCTTRRDKRASRERNAA